MPDLRDQRSEVRNQNRKSNRKGREEKRAGDERIQLQIGDCGLWIEKQSFTAENAEKN
jgi:hypothetical protein